MNKRELIKLLADFDDDYEILCENNTKRVLGLQEYSDKYKICSKAISFDDAKRLIYLEIK